MSARLSPDSRGHTESVGLEWRDTDLSSWPGWLKVAVTAEMGSIPVTAPRLLVPGMEVTEELSETGMEAVEVTGGWARGWAPPTTRGTPPATCATHSDISFPINFFVLF